MTRWLVDTGPLVAYLDASDPAHDRVAACWDAFSGHLLTTSAVVTETMHFVGDASDGPQQFAELLSAASIDVYDLCQPPEVQQAAMLMAKYIDTPMDFADATLLLLAEAVDVFDILTLDVRGFTVYRTRNRRTLRLALPRS